MREEQKRQFFASKSGVPHTIRISGKFVFDSLPINMQDKIKKRLAEKDEVMARGISGKLPGIKIDGRQVTRENLHEFEIPKMSEGKVKKLKVKKVDPKEVKSKYVKEDLEKLSFSKLKKLAKKIGETGRSKVGLIKDILKHN